MVVAQESAEAFTPLYVGTWMRWRWRALQQPVFESLVVSLAMVVLDVLLDDET